MNRKEADILSVLIEQEYINQRFLAENSGYSLGVVNKSLKSLMDQGIIDNDYRPTETARNEIIKKSPKRAVILAAGYGMRMVPINMETPKAFVEVEGEALIERLIKQLHDAGIYEIKIIVGFMKERFEYLIDEFGVELVVNRDYAIKNNLHSLSLVADSLTNCYVLPCDIWCGKNPFKKHELYSWYMVSDLVDDESNIRVNKKNELSIVSGESAGNSMVGISYLTGEEASIVSKRLKAMDMQKKYDNSFWEETLYEKSRMIVNAKVVHSSEVVEINTYEQLRELDEKSNQLQSDAITIISNIFGVKENEISEISVLKKGMTNRSFMFVCQNKKYIMRIPGEGTDKLINRREEAEVYQTISALGICDDLIYINPENGYKITSFLENARVCDSDNEDDLVKCMRKLRSFHEKRLKVNHTFDLYAKIDFYESLWNGQESGYKDYAKTKGQIWELRKYIESLVDPERDYGLVHIDAVADNFLFYKNQKGEEEIRLIDWEYSAMQDTDVDIAMFCIYSLYDKSQIDRLIDIYYRGECTKERRMKIYCYIATCGLLWSNWCEYKRSLGVEFGEYSLCQYRYAKDFYRTVKEEI